MAPWGPQMAIGWGNVQTFPIGVKPPGFLLIFASKTAHSSTPGVHWAPQRWCMGGMAHGEFLENPHGSGLNNALPRAICTNRTL